MTQSVIMADENQFEDQVVEAIRGLGFMVLRAKLPVDFVFEGKGVGGKTVVVGWERKRTNDIIQSVGTRPGTGSGRLNRQLFDAVEWGCHELGLLWEDVSRVDRHGALEIYNHGGWRQAGKPDPMMWRDFDNYLSTLSKVVGVQVKRVGSPQESARTLVNNYWWWQKAIEEHQSYDKLYEPDAGVALLGRHPIFNQILSRIKGFGPTKQADAYKYFQGWTVGDALMAEGREWAKIKGVGKTLAGNVEKAMDSIIGKEDNPWK